MWNRDGSSGSKTTQKELAEFYGQLVVEDQETVVATHMMNYYLSSIYDIAKLAAHHGRKALRQK